MTINISGMPAKLAAKVIQGNLLIALLLLASMTLFSARPAQAQSSDTWKSVAIIGGSTAAGAYIGHRVAGKTGAYVGAASGAAVGYAIDRHRRQNEYYNNGYYSNNGYDPNGGYYPNNGGYYGNSYPYGGNGYQSDQNGNYNARSSRRR